MDRSGPLWTPTASPPSALAEPQASHSNRNQQPRSSSADGGSSSGRTSAASSAGGGRSAAGDDGRSTPRAAALSSSVQVTGPGCSTGGGGVSGPAAVARPYPSNYSNLQQQQQQNVYSQLDLQAKIDERMMMQRRTQHAIGCYMMAGGERASSTASREQLQRLAQHVVLQRLMLQHLYSMLNACTTDLSSSAGGSGSVGTKGRHDLGLWRGV